MKLLKNAVLIIAATFLCMNAMAQTKKDIVDIAVESKAHTTLVTAIKAADLVTTLKSKGPFTVFAPINAAFTKLPEGVLDNLLKPENKSKLAGILTYHVVAGNLSAEAVLAAIKTGGGKAVLTTVAGGKLTAEVVMGKVILTDENGGKATVTATDLKGTNGVIHVIDAVLLPK
ncbi:fasciclin domain-containing protein [soil metagenome]